ncbi:MULTISPECIES: formylglycine-generating enzyme family protein [unclassified Rhizobium]|uniref:SUMF1/EgtB/PvdO family nonheme iron enzyme n=1 Tax=unclassified Rhizobium TaxID=2613769 RepID=UPI0006FC1A52|nr:MULTISPECIES: formylglycine-generating enzyme family protein [unclassified Rhizobium]KQV39964.1 nitrate reductase [Rhizobium sp. Root1212]KRD31674.1 nitrate reductase [Rhizobium sp. Root268]
MRTPARKQTVSLLSIGLPIVLLIGSSAGIAGQLGYFERPAARAASDLAETVSIPAGTFTYRADGEFYKNGFAVDGPMIEKAMPPVPSMMKYQVSEGEYGRCVEAGKCPTIAPAHIRGKDFPVTGVSYDDATAYARWFSEKTGESWVLPTYEQMAFAAGSKFVDDALGVDPDSGNPALRWLADYERETRRKAESDPEPKVRGHFGENEHGLADFAGNVWEWTSTCHRRVDLAGATPARTNLACGIYVTVGQHNSPMSSFVRDPKTGGCAVGAPPANLGFRLIRDDRWYAGLLKRLRDRGIIS